MKLHRTRERMEIKLHCLRYVMRGYAQKRVGCASRIFFILKIEGMYTNFGISNHAVKLEPEPNGIIGIILRGGRHYFKFNNRFLNSQEAQVAAKILHEFAEKHIEV